MVDENQKDDSDIKHQMRNDYAQGNMIIKNFNGCTEEVKKLLFKTYCYNCSHLWHTFSNQPLNRVKIAYYNVFVCSLNLKNKQVYLQL